MTFDIGGTLCSNTNATADHANFLIRGILSDGTPGGEVVFDTGSTAGNATFTLEGGQSGSQSGVGLFFVGFGKAENATIVAKGGVSGSHVAISDVATGDKASITLSGNASLDVSGNRQNSVSIGSLAGSGGLVSLGFWNLSVGSILATPGSPVLFRMAATAREALLRRVVPKH